MNKETCCEKVEWSGDGRCTAPTYMDYDRCYYHKIKSLEAALDTATSVALKYAENDSIFTHNKTYLRKMRVEFGLNKKE